MNHIGTTINYKGHDGFSGIPFRTYKEFNHYLIHLYETLKNESQDDEITEVDLNATRASVLRYAKDLRVSSVEFDENETTETFSTGKRTIVHIAMEDKMINFNIVLT